MTDQTVNLENELDQLVDVEGVLGAALVSRDGIPILSKFTRHFDQMAFSILVEGAMAATLVGSAEEALAEVEGGAMRRTIVESERVRLVLQGTADDLILVTLTDPGRALDKLAPYIDAACAQRVTSKGV